jgi:hypothetical protein
MKTIYGIFVFIVFSVTQIAYAGTLTVSTNKQVYAPGEQITLSITASGFPSQMEFPTSCQVEYIMDGIFDSASGIVCAQVLTGVTLPHTWTEVHSWSRYSPGIGTHYVTAYLEYPWTWYFTSNTAVFSVAAPQPFHVISPNGGEQIVAGSATTILWYNYESGYLYDLAYSTNNGQNWLPIASSVSGSSYAWTVPGDINSNQCLIKVSKLSNPVVTDVSDNPFTIHPPFHIISPNGGEQFSAGSSTTIQWYDYESSYLYDLAYSADNGQTWLPIASSVSGSSYAWDVPGNINSSQCLIKVSKLASPVVADVSDDLFTIYPSFHVISPNGGEHFIAGSIAAIQWQDYEDEFLYDLKYSADGGQNWQSIVSSISGYLHPWAIPNGVNSDQCLVKVIKLADPNVDDSSNTMFTIFECQNSINMDFNHDCYVNYTDYIIISNNWRRSDCTQTNNWCDGSDTYQDGLVNIQDLMLFVEQWLMCDNPFDPDC